MYSRCEGFLTSGKALLLIILLIGVVVPSARRSRASDIGWAEMTDVAASAEV